LQVRIIELQRSVAKQLGVNLNGSTIIDDNLLLDFATATTFPSPAGVANAGFADGTSTLGFSISALERVGMLRTLAEPTITAISGETGNFLAGGEFPVPTGEAQDGGVTIEFRPFGVGLSFTPFVMSKGRISLRVTTEVSELSTEGAISLGEISIPSLTTRRVETTVELGSGKSMMLAGLIQETTRQELSAVPGARNIPVLGALFQGRDYAHDETELVVLVTPILTQANNPNAFSTPVDGFVAATDIQTIFFSKLNRVYGRNGDETNRLSEYDAPVGFIEE
ncbi:MAG: type II and III secretion system protein family protein, partial [Pseudomonadota bacterium]